MHLWWWLLLVTERAFPIKQRLFSVLAKKAQHLFLTMTVPIKRMIKYTVENEKSCLRAWKIKQRNLNELKTWICRQGIILFVPMHPLCQCFPVIFSNRLENILQPYAFPYSGPWQKSKMEFFLRIVIIAWKVSKYGVISGPYFPVFGLNTKIYGVNLRVQSKYRKIRSRNNSVFGHFSYSVREKNSILIENL